MDGAPEVLLILELKTPQREVCKDFHAGSAVYFAVLP